MNRSKFIYFTRLDFGNEDSQYVVCYTAIVAELSQYKRQFIYCAQTMQWDSSGLDFTTNFIGLQPWVFLPLSRATYLL